MAMRLRPTPEKRFFSMAGHLNSWVDHVLGTGYHKYCPGEAWSPSINLYENESSYFLVVDLAGVRGEEIVLNVEEDMIVLSGHRDMPMMHDWSEPMRVHLMEIDQGQFRCRLPLPKDVDVDAAMREEATYRCGYLWVRLPKRA